MNLSRAISIASRWMQGHVVTLRDGEAREYHKLCHEALKRMREQEGKDTNKWISVKDKLPEDGVRVLTACDDGMVRLGISKGEFPSVVNRQHRFSDVTHWMPLPEPPEVEG